ncbi:MAG: hypothetical protein R3320_10285 [Nitriliruptorales bacterium]|nr:hypothetical protein [Nitriliruptorales bacterium]
MSRPATWLARWWSASHGGKAGGLGGGLAAIVVLAPWWQPGALLVRDLVAVGDPAWSLSLLDGGARLPRDIPGEVLTAAVGQVIPADVLVRVLLLVALVVLGAGIGRLLGGMPVAASFVGGVVSVWNPYVWGRLHQGQWLMLVALAAVPWVVVHLRRADVWRLVRVVVLASFSGFLAWIVVVPTLVVVGAAARRWRELLAGLSAAAVMALPWVIVADDVRVDPDAFSAFAPNADLAGGVVPSLLTGGGYFNAAVASPWRDKWPIAVFTLALTVVAGVGVRGWLRGADPADRRARMGLLAAGILTLATTLLAASGAGQDLLVRLAEAVPAVSIVRDSQRLIAPWVAVLAIGVGAAAGQIGARAATPIGVAAVVIGMAAVSLPDPLIGPRLPAPSQLPAAWERAAAIVNGGSVDGAVLVVPYGQTQRYAFTGQRPVAVPLRRLMRAPVAVDTRLVVGEYEVEDRADDDRLRELARRAPSQVTGQELAAAGVAWVAVTDPELFVATPPSGLRTEISAPTLQLLRVGPVSVDVAWAERPSTRVLVIDLLVALAALGAIVAPTVAMRVGRSGRSRSGRSSPTVEDVG